MRSVSFSRPLRFYLLFIALPIFVVLIVFSALISWQRKQPDRSPIEWQAIKPNAILRDWRYIVLHHSDTVRGSTAGIDKHHREVNGWDGVGYHFVIGNGHGMRRGRIEYTFRWNQQREGAHAGGTDKRYNENGIGICMIGDYEDHESDAFQLERSATLCACLIESVPELRVEYIIGHRDVPGKNTKCPGKFINIIYFQRLVNKILKERALAREQTP